MIEVTVDDLPSWWEPLLAGLRATGSSWSSLQVPDADDVQLAAVLVLLADGPAGPDVLLLQRSAHLRSHAGQPAFPGGRIDPGDGGPVGAALREAQEETGLDPAGVQVVATLPELWLPPSSNAVTPVLAWWRSPSEVGPGDPGEVASVARVPVADLVDPANRVMVRHRLGFAGPAFRVADMLVWGFTAAILDRLLSVAGWDVPWDRDNVEPMPRQVD